MGNVVLFSAPSHLNESTSARPFSGSRPQRTGPVSFAFPLDSVWIKLLPCLVGATSTKLRAPDEARNRLSLLFGEAAA